MEGQKVCRWYNWCPIKTYVEEGKLPNRWVQNYCFNDGFNCVRKRLEERGIYHPDSLLPDGTIDKNLE